MVLLPKLLREVRRGKTTPQKTTAPKQTLTTMEGKNSHLLMDTVLFPEIFPNGTNQVNISH